MVYVNQKKKNPEEPQNDFSVATISLAKLYVSRRPYVREHYFVSLQLRAFHMQTYVYGIVAGDINLP